MNEINNLEQFNNTPVPQSIEVFPSSEIKPDSVVQVENDPVLGAPEQGLEQKKTELPKTVVQATPEVSAGFPLNENPKGNGRIVLEKLIGVISNL